MCRLILLSLSSLLFTVVGAGAVNSASSEIVAGPRAPHIGGVTGDRVIVATGSTFSFTVDTPSDQGRVSTKPSVRELLTEIAAKDGSTQHYRIKDQRGAEKAEGQIEGGDSLEVTPQGGVASASKSYALELKPLALSGQLHLEHDSFTVNTRRDIALSFTAGQRSPDATVKIFLPIGVEATLDNTTVNVIGRGAVTLRDLPVQSIGRVGSAYSYSKVGEVSIGLSADGGSVLTFSHLDLRPANGADLKLVISGVKLLKAGTYLFKASYTTAKPEVLESNGNGNETAALVAVPTISNFSRVIDRSLRYKESPDTYTAVNFQWTSSDAKSSIRLMHSLDNGKSWSPAAATIDPKTATASVTRLDPDKLHAFRLDVLDGPHKGSSNVALFYSGKLDVKTQGAIGDGKQDDTDKINEAIMYLGQIGGGTLLFTKGVYNVRTVQLQSNVYLFVDRDATISASKGGDAPESTWFSDLKYRSGLSPTDAGPYADPENWLTKQDVGHHYFRNTMFFGERLDNVKIIGNGRITGNNNLVTGDNVMRNPPGSRADKMFTLKLCTHLEIGGLAREEDLWYDSEKDEPYYIARDGGKIADLDNMLQIDRAGHFVLLATGTDGIDVHDTYHGRQATGNSRDIYDFMECNDVTATNIYCKVTSDDIVKPGSDCSLGFTRPAKNYRVRNIIGDTNCNLFQIGSETADDIMDVHVDNIYVLGANKAGFSISTNDGGHVKDVHLNCGHTGPLRLRSKMLRTHTPFFLSISNRGRILGATVARFKFDENGKPHDELLNTNINIGLVENIILNGVDVSELYTGSSYGGKPRWKPYDGSQKKAAPIVAGYKLPESEVVQGGLNFKLPNGKHTGYIKNVVFNDIHILAKGGNPKTDTDRLPPELGVGQYNAADLGVLPTYGFYARHVQDLTVTDCTFAFEKPDSTPALYLDDVVGAKISSVKMLQTKEQTSLIKVKGSHHITVEKAEYREDNWNNAPIALPPTKDTTSDVSPQPPKATDN
jgi:polygalacturonase